MQPFKRFTMLAGLALVAQASAAMASAPPTGIWIDHTGRGGIEIKECGKGLCGHIVWLKDGADPKGCGIQILGNVKPTKPGMWDNGWIYDPEEDARFSVELKPLSGDRLRVMGYLGTKLFNETFVWKRAPAEVKRCGTDTITASQPAAAPPPRTAAVAPKSEPSRAAPATADTPSRPSAVPEYTPPTYRDNAAPSERRAETAKPAQPPRVAEAAPQKAPKATENKPRSKPRKRGRTCRLDLPYITVEYPCID